MPSAKARSSRDLGIRLQPQGNEFFPGDTIVGAVYRWAAIVATEATIRVSLHGRTKSTLMFFKAAYSYIHRGRFDLVNSSERIFRGPMHIPSDTRTPQEWPFAIAIPEHVDGRFFPGDYKANDSYLPINSESAAQRILPASFEDAGEMQEASVEYFIQATIRYQRQGSWMEEKASMPLQILAFNPGAPLSDFELQYGSHEKAVTSQRLIPGMESAHLSKTAKMKKFFGTPSVPTFRHHVEVGIPTIIQLDDRPIPFAMRVLPSGPRQAI